MNTADYFSNAPWKAGFEVPNYQQICFNCFKNVDDYAAFNHRTKSGFTTKNHVCFDCLEEVIIFRTRIRNVSKMTKELVNAVDKRNHQIAWEQMCDKIGGKVRHI